MRFTLEDVAETPRGHLVTVRLNGLGAAIQQNAATMSPARKSADTRLTASPMGADLPVRTTTVEKDSCVPVDTKPVVACLIRREQA